MYIIQCIINILLIRSLKEKFYFRYCVYVALLKNVQKILYYEQKVV